MNYLELIWIIGTSQVFNGSGLFNIIFCVLNLCKNNHMGRPGLSSVFAHVLLTSLDISRYFFLKYK